MYYLQLPVFLLRNLSTKYRAIKERAAEDKQYTIHMYCSHSQYVPEDTVMVTPMSPSFMASRLNAFIVPTSTI